MVQHAALCCCEVSIPYACLLVRSLFLWSTARLFFLLCLLIFFATLDPDRNHLPLWVLESLGLTFTVNICMHSDVITCFCHTKSLPSFLDDGWDAYALQRQLATVETMATVVHVENRTATHFMIHKRYHLIGDILREFLKCAESERLIVGLRGKVCRR